jgi:hypothetical protein
MGRPLVTQRELAALAPGEVPDWVADLSRLARSEPSATLDDAARLLGTSRHSVLHWLHYFDCDSLAMRLRKTKTRLAWVALIDEALGRDPSLTLAGVVELFGRSRQIIIDAVYFSGRRDLCDRLGIKPPRMRDQAEDDVQELVPLRRKRVRGPQFRFSGPSMPGWGAVVEAALTGYPGLTLPELADRINRTEDTIGTALAFADRADLLYQLIRNRLRAEEAQDRLREVA